MNHKLKMILSSGTQPTIERRGQDAIHVATPLELITRLERESDRRIRTIVLAGGYASNYELARFLDAFYPAVHVEREV